MPRRLEEEMTEKEQKGTFWDDGKILHLILSGDYTGTYNCPNSLN